MVRGVSDVDHVKPQTYKKVGKRYELIYRFMFAH